MRRRDMQLLQQAPPSPRRSAAYQLTPIWERVLRTRRLPAEADLTQLVEALRRRLGDPEREVRQHALRVLADLIPVIRPSLDARVSPLLPELLLNLGHPAPAVRKSALDALKIYLSHSEMKQAVLADICTTCLEKTAFADNAGEDVTIGLILALPSLLRYAEEPSRSISTVIKALSANLLQPPFRDATMRSMLKLKDIIGREEFKNHIDKLDPTIAENFNALSKLYENPQPVVEPQITVDVDSSERVPSGKVILETEFAFDSDTEITMTIMEEDVKPNAPPESEDDSFDYATYNKSLVKVLTDSEQDEYEATRRTPRRVRFGGEVVKMRTPDSDNVINSDGDADADNSDSSGAKKRRSMIPLPTLPSKSVPKPRKRVDLNKRKSKSLNDLSEYCKLHFKSTPNGDVTAQSTERLPRSPMPSPRKLAKKTIKDALQDRGFPVEDLSSGYSGNSSTGSGSSSDNAYEDFALEDLGILDRGVFKDLFKTGDDRAVVQAIEKLSREVSSSAASAQAIEPSLGVISARLASLGPRGRSGIAATGLLRTLIRSCRPAALKATLPRLAAAIAAQGARGNALTADLARKLSSDEIIDILLNQSSPHWKSSKLRAGSLRVVAILGNITNGPGSTGSAVGTRAARAAAGSCRHPRRRVRAAALDALAALAHLASPRAVLAALHHEASDRNDGDQLYDAVFARLCRSEETKRPGGAARGTQGRVLGPPAAPEARPDLAWVMAGSTSASPPSVHRHAKKLETNWPRSAPDLPALVEAVPSTPRTYYSFSAQRKHDQDKGERNVNALVDARVLTAPPAGVTLRPLVVQHVQHSVWPRQGLAWPQQPAPPWIQTPGSWQASPQAPAWTSMSASWGGVQGGGNPQAVGGGSWPQRRPPPQLRALTPPPNRPRLQPLSSQNSSNWSSTQDDDGQKLGAETPPSSKNQLEITRDREDLINRSSQASSTDNNGARSQQYKSDEVDNDTQTHKSENGFVRAESTSTQASPISRGSHWRVSTPNDLAPSPHSSIVPQDSIEEFHNDVDLNSSYDNDPPMLSDDAEESSHSDNRIPTTPSTTEMRFVDEPEVENDLENKPEYNSEERFINMKPDSPKSVKSLDILPNDNFIAKQSPAHSTHSQYQPAASPISEELDNRRNLLNSAPAISFLGSSMSLEDDRKSIESTLSDNSLKKSPKIKEDVKFENVIEDEIENHSILGNKISPIKKTPKKSTKTIPFSSKMSRNKIQPIQDSATATLLPFDKPKDMLAKAMDQLESTDWESVITGLQNMERLVKFHPILIEAQLKTTARAISAQIKNLRSQVARAACKLAGNMFDVHKKGLEPEADELAMPLLQRTADTNKFIRIDANNALDKMCESISMQKSISILITKGTSHPNAIVRCASARLLANIAKTSGAEKLFNIQRELRDKLFQSGADLLTEGSLETRGHAKQLFTILSQNNHFFKTIREVISLSKYRNIEKILNSLRV